MELLTDELKEQLKPFDPDADLAETKALVKLHSPTAGGVWYISNHNGNKNCWCLVVGAEVEFGVVNLRELEAVNGFGSVERDDTFTPTPFGELWMKHTRSEL